MKTDKEETILILLSGIAIIQMVLLLGKLGGIYPWPWWIILSPLIILEALGFVCTIITCWR